MRRHDALKALRKAVPTLAQFLVLGAIGVTAYVAYNAGVRHGGGHGDTTVQRDAAAGDASGEAVTIYTCSMHPEIRQEEPGNCPICGMELVPAEEVDEPAPADDHAAHDHNGGEPELLGYACAMNCLPPLEEDGPCPICGMEMQPVYSEDDDAPAGEERSPRRMTMSSEAVALASVETAVARRGSATREVRLVGQTVEDPRRRVHISANVGGRVDVLHAEFDGDVVEAGQPLAEIYSPELLAVQEELLQVLEGIARLEDEGVESGPGRSQRATVDAIRHRLVLAGLSERTIDDIVETGSARERVVLEAPAGGTVTARYVEQGDYAAAEQRLLTLVDHGVLWAELEAFESDLPWLLSGQEVSYTARSFPGRTFTGTVAWIDPVTNPETRTTRVRVDVENPDGHLKPGMFLSAIVDSRLDEAEQPLLIPATAPLVTGRRAIVYTMIEDTTRPTFEGREVVLGPRVREGYVVLEGLSEGERVVTRGAFQLDAALQIIARPSMMSPDGGQPVDGHAGHGVSTEDHADHDDASEEHSAHDAPAAEPPLTPEELSLLLPHYLTIHEALAADDEEEASLAWETLGMLAGARGAANLQPLLDEVGEDADMAELRRAFEPLSAAAITSIMAHGNPSTATLHIIHCPMAFDWEGADWLQTGDDVRNPYFGAEMYRCGTVEAEVAPR